MRVITFSRYFPKGHPKAGEPTYFVEKILKGYWNGSEWPPIIDELLETYVKSFSLHNVNHYTTKHHTIRAGNRWKVGDVFSPRVWLGKPYRSKQIQFAPPIEIKKIWKFTFNGGCFSVNGEKYFGEVEGDFELLELIALNDGLTRHELVDWIKQPKNNTFDGQILCWNSEIKY